MGYFDDDTQAAPPAPKAKNNYFADKPKPSAWYDTALSALSGIPKGIAGIAGLPRDIGDLADSVTAWAGQKIGMTPQQIRQDQIKRGRMTGLALPVSTLTRYMPSTQQIIDTANKASRKLTGYELYDPQTVPGRIASNVTSALPSAALGSEKLATNLARNLPIAATSGLGQGVAREVVGNDSPYADAAGVVGSLIGGIGAGTAQAARAARSAPAVTQRAANIASQALKEGHANPGSALSSLRSFNTNRPSLLPGVKPTTAQVVGTGEAQGLENAIAGLGSSPEIAALKNAKDYSLEQMSRGQAFDPATGTVDLSKAIGSNLPEVSPVSVPREPPIDDINSATRSALGIDEGEQGAHATRAKNALTKIEEHYADQERKAWNNLDETGAELDTEPVLASVRNYLDNLDEADKPYVPARVNTVLGNLADKFTETTPKKPFATSVMGYPAGYDPATKTWSYKGQPATPAIQKVLNEQFPDIVAAPAVEGAPIREIQGFRRNVLKDARAATKQGDENTARILNGLAGTLGDSLANPENYNFASETAPQAWQKAVAATRQHKQFFGSGPLGEAVETSPTGEPRVPGDAFFEHLFKGGSQAGDKLRHLQSIPGIDADSVNSAVSDWLVGKMTKNGTKLDMTPEQVNQFANVPANKTIIDQVPGLQDRLDAIQGAAHDRLGALAEHGDEYRADVARNADEVKAHGQAQKLSDQFQTNFNGGSPAKLADFIASNRDDLKATMPPEQAPFLDALENSARYVAKLPAGAPHDTRTLQALKDGTMFSLLYGKAAGAITNATAGELIGDMMAGAGLHGLGRLGATLGLVGYAKRTMPFIEKHVSNLVLGDTRDEAINMLQRAASDPELAQALMERPSAEGFNGVLDVLKKGAQGAGKSAAKTTALTLARPPYPNEPPPEDQSDLMDTSDGNFAVPADIPADTAPIDVPVDAPADRMGRKSGGRVEADIDRMAKALIAKAKKAKKESDKSTEPLLKVDDSVIAKALHVANKVRGQ